jgi:hypothetical protein
MRTTIMRAGLILSLLVATGFGAPQMMRCRETGKTVDKCCCDMMDGKFYCTLTKKTYDKCCCDMSAKPE